MIKDSLAVQTIGLNKYFGTFAAVKDLNLEVESNSVYGFLGPNGSGKTTTIRILTGLSQASGGHAYIYGADASDRSLQTRRMIGYLPDVPSFHKYMTGLEYLIFCGELFGYTTSEAKKEAYTQLERTDMVDAATRKTGGYSRGMKQRLGLAAALIGNPKVLFLDEPVSALDPMGRNGVLNIIKDLSQSKTIFLSTHILSDVERVCDSVGIINHGELVVSSSVAELKKRYIQNRFVLRFVQDPASLLDIVRAQNWCKEAQVTQNEEGIKNLLVEASEPIAARDSLPFLAMQNGFTITHYEMVQPSVEDIFMQLTGVK